MRMKAHIRERTTAQEDAPIHMRMLFVDISNDMFVDIIQVNENGLIDILKIALNYKMRDIMTKCMFLLPMLRL